MRALFILKQVRRVCLGCVLLTLCGAKVLAQAYSSASNSDSVQWKDGRVTLRSEEPGRLRVGVPSGENTTATSDSTSPAAEKKDTQSESTKKEENNSLSAFYLSTLVEEQPMRMAPVIGGVPIFGGGLPRMHSPGYRLFGLDVYPSVAMTSTYNDNIFLHSGKEGQKIEGDFIQYITPQIKFATANSPETSSSDSLSFDLDTSPSALFFMDHNEQNTVNNNTAMSVSKRFSKTSVYVSQSYASVTGGNLESGDLISNDWYITNAWVQYEMSPKISFSVLDKLIVRSYNQGYDSMDNLVSTWLTYFYSEKIQLGIAPGYGMVDADNGPNQQYQQGSVRIGYIPSEKLSMYLQTGIERREYQKSDLERYDIVFSGGAKWAISAKSSLNTEISRRTQASNAYQNQDVTVTGVSSNLRHGVAKDVSASLGAGYDHSQYESSSTTGSANREDNYFTLNPSVQWTVLEWWDVSFSYMYRRNFSQRSVSEFENNIVSVGSTLRF